MAAERFRVDGKTYRVDALDEISLKEMLLFDDQAEDMGLRARWADVEQATIELQGATAKDFASHPRNKLIISAAIWVARRLSGEEISLDAAVGVPFKNFEWIESPKDHAPSAKKTAKPRSRSVRPVPNSDDEPPVHLPTPSSETSEPRSESA
jgi:hypothetical protein